MKINRRAALALAVGAPWFWVPRIALANGQAGTVQKVEGDATSRAAGGAARKLEEKAPIYMGDTLATEADSALSLLFADDTKFDIGQKASLVIDEFVYSPGSGGKIGTGILKGSFRFVSGKIAAAKPETMVVRSPVATIGVRGTSVVGEVLDSSASFALVEPEGSARPTAIQVANAAGAVIIDQPGWGTDVAGPNVAPSPPYRWESQRINGVIQSITNIQRVMIPRPRVR